MNCPKCQISLEKYDYKGIETGKCPNCQGMWFDYEELDELEDKEFSIDELKGSLIFRPEEVDLKCPICDKKLISFQYRLYDMHLETCEDSHGFWLDAGEEKRVLEIMDQREKDLERKFKAEEKWKKTLKKMKKKTLLDKLKYLIS